MRNDLDGAKAITLCGWAGRDHPRRRARGGHTPGEVDFPAIDGRDDRRMDSLRTARRDLYELQRPVRKVEAANCGSSVPGEVGEGGSGEAPANIDGRRRPIMSSQDCVGGLEILARLEPRTGREGEKQGRGDGAEDPSGRG